MVGPVQTSLGLRKENGNYWLEMQVSKGIANKGYLLEKKAICEPLKPSPNHKRTRIQSPHKTNTTKTSSCNLFSPRYKLNWDGSGIEEETDLTQNVIQAAEAVDQPYRQPCKY